MELAEVRREALAPGEWHRKANELLDSCVICHRPLAVIRGEIVVAAPDPGGALVKENSPRARRKSFIGCGTCNTPVPQDHPRQVALDREWDVLEAREAAAKQRAQQAPPVPFDKTAYGQSRPFELLQEQVAALAMKLDAVLKRLERVETTTGTTSLAAVGKRK